MPSKKKALTGLQTTSLPSSGVPIDIDADLATGLVCWLQQIEGSGTLLEDSSGNGHHARIIPNSNALGAGGTVRGFPYGATISDPEGILSRAVLYDTVSGTGSGGAIYARIPYHPQLDFSTAKSFLFSAWYNRHGSENGNATVSHFTNTPSAYSGWMLWHNTSGVNFYINGASRINGSPGIITSSVNSWLHVVVYWDGSKVYAGYNGVLTGSASFSTAPANGQSDIIVGGYYNNGNDDGTSSFNQLNDVYLADMRWYRDRTFTASDIYRLYDPASKFDVFGFSSIGASSTSQFPSLGGAGLSGLSAMSGLSPIM